jgi:hypothetical protein
MLVVTCKNYSIYRSYLLRVSWHLKSSCQIQREPDGLALRCQIRVMGQMSVIWQSKWIGPRGLNHRVGCPG